MPITASSASSTPTPRSRPGSGPPPSATRHIRGAPPPSRRRGIASPRPASPPSRRAAASSSPSRARVGAGGRGARRVAYLDIDAIVEAAIWTSFVAFKVQQSMRTDTYLRTAELSAGIDLRDDDADFAALLSTRGASLPSR